MRANSPVASEKAKPRIAYAKSWPVKKGRERGESRLATNVSQGP